MQQTTTRRVFGAMALALASAQAVDAQIGAPPEIAVDPDLPVKEGFDVERAYLGRAPMFTPIRDPDWIPLRSARRDGAVADDTPVLVFEAGGETLVLVTAQMSYHHVAQGEMAGEPWMVTF
jgi:hypothetical protein